MMNGICYSAMQTDAPHAPIGVVLAGGHSRRLGRDKALLRTACGLTLLERTVAALRAAGVPEIALAISTPRRGLALRDAVPAMAGVPLIADLVPECGPLGGLQAALRAYPSRHVLLLACDMPCLTPAVLRAICDEPRDADILVPCPAGRYQPLHALYGPACLPVAERLLAEERPAMHGLLGAPELRVRRLDDAWLERHGVPASVFANVNTPADLAALACAVAPPAHG